MGIGLQGPFGLASLDDLLRQRYLDKLHEQQLAEQTRQFNVGAAERSRAHDLQVQMRNDALKQQEQLRQDAATQNFAQGMTPPMDVTGNPIVGRLQSAGLGGYLKSTVAQPIPESPIAGLGTAGAVGPQEALQATPASDQFTGGAGYQQKRMAAGEAMAQLQEKLQAARDIADQKARDAAERAAQNDYFKQLGLSIQQANANTHALLANNTIQNANEKRTIAQQQQETARQNELDTANNMLGMIDKLQNHPGQSYGVGTGSDILSYPSSSSGRAYRNLLEPLRSTLTLERMQQLREGSRNGSTGLSRITNAEFQTLGNAIANLTPNSPVEAHRQALEAARAFFQKLKASNEAEIKAASPNDIPAGWVPVK